MHEPNIYIYSYIYRENITQDGPIDPVNIDYRDLPNYSSPSASDSDDLPNVEESGDNVPFEASSSDDDFLTPNRLPRLMSMSPFRIMKFLILIISRIVQISLVIHMMSIDHNVRGMNQKIS